MRFSFSSSSMALPLSARPPHPRVIVACRWHWWSPLSVSMQWAPLPPSHLTSLLASEVVVHSVALDVSRGVGRKTSDRDRILKRLWMVTMALGGAIYWLVESYMSHGPQHPYCWEWRYCAATDEQTQRWHLYMMSVLLAILRTWEWRAFGLSLVIIIGGVILFFNLRGRPRGGS